MSIYTYRLRAAKGLEPTLMKELRTQLGFKSDKLKEIPGRKAIEVKGDQSTLYRLLSQSRILENVQVKVGSTFIARGEKELQTNLQKIPLHAYLPTSKHEEFAMPRCSAKSYKSKLFHSHLCRNLLLSHLIELPIQREFKRLPYEQQRNYAEFKKQWLAKFNKARDPLSQTEKAKRDLKKQQKEQSDQDG